MFLYSGAMKFAAYRVATRSIRNYKLLPRVAADAAGSVLPFAEVGAGSTLLANRGYPLAAAARALLGTAVLIASLHRFRLRIDVACGCTGGLVDERVNLTTVARALVILSGSVMLL